jgi:hypothetical protein
MPNETFVFLANASGLTGAVYIPAPCQHLLLLNVIDVDKTRRNTEDDSTLLVL